MYVPVSTINVQFLRAEKQRPPPVSSQTADKDISNVLPKYYQKINYQNWETFIQQYTTLFPKKDFGHCANHK